MGPTQPVFCAGSRKHSNSHSYSQYKDRNSQVSSFEFQVSGFTFWVSRVEVSKCFLGETRNTKLETVLFTCQITNPSTLQSLAAVRADMPLRSLLLIWA